MSILSKLIRGFKWWALGGFFKETYLLNKEHIVAAKILYDKKGLLGLKQLTSAYVYNWNTQSMDELLQRANVWIDCISRYESHGSVSALLSVPSYNSNTYAQTLYEYVDGKSIVDMMGCYEQMISYYCLYANSSDPIIQKTLAKAKPIIDEMFSIILFCQNDNLE